MVEVETIWYERAHGKRPYGPGCWAFQFGYGGITKWFHRDKAILYSQAKKMAIEYNKEKGLTVHTIYVLP